MSTLGVLCESMKVIVITIF